MRTGLSKRQKETNIYFDEADGMVEVRTHNTALKTDLPNMPENIHPSAT